MVSIKQALAEKILRRVYNYGYVAPVLSLTSRFPVGTNVFEKEWDALILLDTCRVDALSQIASEYEFLPSSINNLTSVGSTSSEWIAHTFSEQYRDEIQNTAYISGNGHAQFILEDGKHPEETEDVPACTQWTTVDSDALGALKHIWRYDHGPGHVRPEIVTDAAINIARSDNFDRIIIHYSQPHAPYTARIVQEGGQLQEHEEQPFRYLLSGGSREKVFETYLSNLRWVLRSVSKLLKNLDAPKTIISSDHGEAFGEFGFYGHQVAAPIPEIKYVPWAVTTGIDKETYTPDLEWKNHSATTVEEHLKALGYRD